jgi:CheY-like chemotaxis protein
MEATPTGQPVWVEAQVVTLERIACHDYFGRLKPGPHVRVLIRDTGTGMTPDRWRRILVEPFFTTKPRHRGLGLLMAYGVLAVNQGGLLLTRAQERGVLAEFLVPVAPGPSLPVAVQASTAVVAGRSEKILVVDDDPMVLRLVQTTLEKAGYAVQTVENAEDAYRSYTTAPPNSFDLVLSDVMMPRTTGVDLARQLLRCDGKVRLLFMSGQVNGELDAIDLRKRIALVTKPFRPEVLVQAVRTAIARQSDWDDASETYKKAL